MGGEVANGYYYVGVGFWYFFVGYFGEGGFL